LFSNEQAMNETAVYSCKISATIADPDGETPVTVGDSRLGIKEGHAGGTWPSPRATALFVGLGGARSPRENSVKARLRYLVEVYLASDARSAILFLFTRFPIAIDQVIVSSN
jgi:hypothetical protein